MPTTCNSHYIDLIKLHSHCHNWWSNILTTGKLPNHVGNWEREWVYVSDNSLRENFYKTLPEDLEKYFRINKQVFTNIFKRVALKANAAEPYKTHKKFQNNSEPAYKLATLEKCRAAYVGEIPQVPIITHTHRAKRTSFSADDLI